MHDTLSRKALQVIFSRTIKTLKKMGNILVIDDERPIRRTLSEILEFEKYKVD